ncbi:MAG: UDP-N-acetylmuramoyl-L-alanine--D-glutamate ligase [Bordetella sp.]|nr:MAG: UDP-N-acetylmuramoyl-L-alanine--D-glutamate ligase [Bordetella sp.]
MNIIKVDHEIPLILIFGLGETGISVALWYARRNFRLRIADTRYHLEHLNKSFAENLKNVEVEYLLGESIYNTKLLDGVSKLVISPFFSPKRSARKIIGEASLLHIEIISEIEIFSRALIELKIKKNYDPVILAITGTNGKTTVTSLTGKLVAASGLSVIIAGNIGPSALWALMKAMDRNELPKVWVLELSSFQLYDLKSLMPTAAILLNLSEDHLDWHGSMDEYCECKIRLLKMAKIAFINRDDPIISSMVYKTGKTEIKSFGTNLPNLVGDMGIKLGKNGLSWLSICDFKKNKKLKKNTIVNQLVPLKSLKIQGMHNALNALAALQLTEILNRFRKSRIKSLIQYSGEPHRLNFICTHEGIDYVNDSKSTNIASTIAALKSIQKKVILILGGLSKGQDFSLLIDIVKYHAKGIILIGKDSQSIENSLRRSGILCIKSSDLSQAVKASNNIAMPGNTILLSPACSSKDMFQSYSHRGQIFVNEVLNFIANQNKKH